MQSNCMSKGDQVDSGLQFSFSFAINIRYLQRVCVARSVLTVTNFSDPHHFSDSLMDAKNLITDVQEVLSLLKILVSVRPLLH